MLLQGDRRWQPVNGIHVGHAGLIDQATRVGRDGFEVAPLRLGEDRAEGQRGLAGPRHAGEHHQCIAWNGDIDILQVVLARTADLDAAAGCGST